VVVVQRQMSCYWIIWWPGHAKFNSTRCWLCVLCTRRTRL